MGNVIVVRSSITVSIVDTVNAAAVTLAGTSRIFLVFGALQRWAERSTTPGTSILRAYYFAVWGAQKLRLQRAATRGSSRKRPKQSTFEVWQATAQSKSDWLGAKSHTSFGVRTAIATVSAPRVEDAAHH